MSRCQSYDIFDTLLTRAVGAPTSLFLVLAHRLRRDGVTQCSAVEFRDARVAAEAQGRRIRPSGEVTLAEIYHQLAGTLTWSPQQCEAGMRAECELEEQLIVAVPGARERVETSRRQCGSVVFMSDMYLPATMIKRMLVSHDLWQEGDRLYVSNDADATKASGRLYSHMLQAERLEPGDVTHCGNDRHSDVTSPRRLGLNVTHFCECDLNRFEQILERSAAATDGLSPLLAGASRLARLAVAARDVRERTIRDVRERTIRDVTAGAIAPVLVSFVAWILVEAQRQQLRRLYFVSRDGQILLRIAELLAPRLGIECELRYLYGSRQAWHLPAVTAVDESKLAWMCMKYDFVSVRSILFRVGIEPAQFASELTAAGFAAESWDDGLGTVEIERMKTLLSGEPLRDRILEIARQRREVAVEYFQQEGLFASDKWAMVDVGWNGRLQASLGEILHLAGGPSPRGFYFALASRPASPSAGALHAFLFDEQHASRGGCSNTALATILEIACAADHGTVDGYCRVDGSIRPVLRESHNEPAERWGLALMQQTILEFARRLMLPHLEDIDPRSMRQACDALLAELWNSPTRAEADVWGSFPFASDQSGTTPSAIAQPFALRHVAGAVIGNRLPKTASTWDAGSLAMSPPVVRQAIRAGRRCKAVLRQISSGL